MHGLDSKIWKSERYAKIWKSERYVEFLGDSRPKGGFLKKSSEA